MKTFGVVGEENKKSTRKKMPKIRLILSIICHRYFDTNHSAGGGRLGLAVFVNEINNLVTQSSKKFLAFAS